MPVFSWIFTDKKKDSNKSKATISPPEIDLELVKKIKDKKYYSFFFEPSLFEELVDKAEQFRHVRDEQFQLRKDLCEELLKKYDNEESSEDEYISSREKLRTPISKSTNAIIENINWDFNIDELQKEYTTEKWNSASYDIYFPNIDELESGTRNNIPLESLTEIIVENPLYERAKLTENDMKELAAKISEHWGGNSDEECMPSLVSEEESDDEMPPLEPDEEISKKSPDREHPEGYLELFIGPMFSSKSTKILFKLSSMADQRFKCLYINSSKDNRNTEVSDATVTTHNSAYCKLSDKITQIKVKNLSDIDISNFDYIAVDELQFFDDAIETIKNWVSEKGKYVLVASLDGDCYRRKFGPVLDLIPYADDVTKLKAYCDICRDNYGKLKPAPFTIRLTNDTSAELVGGTDLYRAACRECQDFHLKYTTVNKFE